MLYFKNARECFSQAHSNLGRKSAEDEFYHKFAYMIPDTVDVDTLVLAFKIAYRDAEKRGENTLGYIALAPHYVRQCTSPEFAHEFRLKFNRYVLGLTQEPLPDIDYGYKEVEEDIIDISNKDVNEVLAALYNASTPVGMGFAQYNPIPWNKETAKMYIEQFGKSDSNKIYFRYILGRPVHFNLEDNLLYVKMYNNDNEWGLAQRVIATCPNIEKNKTL